MKKKECEKNLNVENVFVPVPCYALYVCQFHNARNLCGCQKSQKWNWNQQATSEWKRNAVKGQHGAEHPEANLLVLMRGARRYPVTLSLRSATRTVRSTLLTTYPSWRRQSLVSVKLMSDIFAHFVQSNGDRTLSDLAVIISYASYTKTMLPMRKSRPRSSRQSNHMKTS